MINLIPPKAKKIVIREYWTRVFVVWLFMLSIVLLIMAFLSVPTYILLRSLESAMASQIDYAKAEQGSYKELERTIKNTNALVNHLNLNEEQLSFSALLSELDAVAGPLVTLTQFGFIEEEGVLKQVSLLGQADTRVLLSTFRDKLEAHEAFASVDLPISNLAKDKDITFSMKVSLETEATKP